MLVVTRKSGQSLMIGDNIEVKVLSVAGEKIRIGIQAPKEITVHRSEVYQEIVRQNRLATHSHIPSPALLSRLKK